MKFALLGADEQALELARFVAESPEHELVWACELGSAAPQIRALAPEAKIAPHWESLVGGTIADATIVARGADDDQRADQLRKLVQAAVPLLISHPIHDSMLVYYELDMIRRETGSIMLPYIPERWHPGVARLLALLRGGVDSEIGAAEQLVIERAMAERSKATVEAQFARDADLARALCGDLTSLAAMAPAGKETPDYGNLGVQLSGPGGILVRWSVGPLEHAAGAKVTLVGSAGKATLEPGNSGEGGTFVIIRGGQSTSESFAAWNPPAVAVEQLGRAMAGAAVEPAWPEACRDVELSESIARSLAKGRTIELHNEQHSEHGTFKGTMTSVGCGLLWASLAVFLIAAALAQITGKAIFAYTPHFILGALAIFLAIQLLKLVFPSEE